MNPYLKQLRHRDDQSDDFGFDVAGKAEEGLFNFQAAVGSTVTKYKGLLKKLVIGGVVVGVGAIAFRKIQANKELQAEGSMNTGDDDESASPEQMSLFEVTEDDSGDVITQQLLEQSDPMDEMDDESVKGSSNIDRLMYGSGGPPKRTRRRSQPTTSGMRGKIGPSAAVGSNPIDRYVLGSAKMENQKKPFYELNGDPAGLTEKKIPKAKAKDPFLGSKMEMPSQEEEEKHIGKGFLQNVKPLF